MLPMTRYMIRNQSLAPWVKFIWSFVLDDGNISYQLLPTDTFDILINLSGRMIYQTKTSEYDAPDNHINGLRKEHSMIRQTGKIRVYGVSFYAYGLYPYIHGPITKINDRITDLSSIEPSFSNQLENAARNSPENKVFENMEHVLYSELNTCESDIQKVKIIESFLSTSDASTVNEYCIKQNMNVKTFERMMVKYTGYMPKVLHRLRRFQITSNQLVHQREVNLADIAYDNSFSDQSHFTREFQGFTGIPPREFQSVKKSVKENTIYKII